MKTIKFLIVILLIILSGCGNSSKKETKKIFFGISPFQDTFLPIIGKEKGWYQEEGLDIEFKILGWTEIQEALSSNSKQKIDIGINNISSVVATYNNNPNLVYLYGFNTFDNGFALMIRPDNKLKPLSYFLSQGFERNEAIRLTSQQLKGKKVITTSNTDMEQGVAAAAKKGGLSFKTDIEIINLNPDEGLAAFLTGNGDAYIGGIPQRTRAGKEGMVEMLTGIDLGPAPINGIVSTKDFYKNHKEEIIKILKVWFRIVNYVEENKDEAAAIIVKKLNETSSANFTIDDFKLFWNNYEHYPLSPEIVDKEILSETGRNYWKARWDDCNNYFFEIAKVIPKPVKPEDAFFMPEVQDLLKQSLKR
jgi:NitT/TauT family transport system substrate-binding protein